MNWNKKLNQKNRLCVICSKELNTIQKSCCSKNCSIKYRASLAGKVNRERLSGRVSMFKGHHFSEESKSRLSESLRNSYASGKISHWTKKRTESEISEIYTRAGISSGLSRKGLIFSKHHKEMISKNNARYWKGKLLPNDVKKKLSIARTNYLRSSNQKWIKVSKSEAAFGDAIFREFSILLESSFWLGGKCYDYKIPSKNILIECDGHFWHSDDNESDKLKDKIAKDNGYEIYRFRINNVSEVDEVIQDNKEVLRKLFGYERQGTEPQKEDQVSQP